MAIPDDFQKAYEDLSMKLEDLFTEDEIIYYILSDNHGGNTENVSFFYIWMSSSMYVTSHFVMCRIVFCFMHYIAGEHGQISIFLEAHVKLNICRCA